MLDGPRITWILRMTADSFYFIDSQKTKLNEMQTGPHSNVDLSVFESGTLKSAVIRKIRVIRGLS